MSRFHFDASLTGQAEKALTALDNSVSEVIAVINQQVDILRSQDGFGIYEIIERLVSESNYAGKLGEKARDGAEVIRSIFNSADNYNKMASNFVSGLVSAGADAVNSVVNSRSQVAEPDDRYIPEIVANPLEGFPEGSWVDAADENYAAIPNNQYSLIRVDIATKGENYIVLQPTAMDIFEKGTYRGYKQTTQNGLGGWFDSKYQCVATAKATTAMYSGIYDTPYNEYSGSDYSGGWDGCAKSCNWSGYGEMDPQQFVTYCTERLHNGQATTIYAHHDETHDTGHAATVVGYVNTGAANPVWDLIVVNPWDGEMYRLGDCYDMTHDKNGWFTLEYTYY